MNGAWQLWKDDITGTEMQFTAIPGHSLYFRVRSKDRVDNEGQSAVMGPYEAKLETIKYYYFGGQRVAMRRCDVGGACDDPLYLHGDHLGSVSLTTNASGAVVSQARYMPYGEVRWITNTMSTDYGFTGQRLDGFGLMDFNARYFSPRLGRFISADSIVPNTGDATSFDRYAFVNNNPLRFVDPTGHGACDGPFNVPECDELGSKEDLLDTLDYYGWTVTDPEDFSLAELEIFVETLMDIKWHIDVLTQGKGRLWIDEYISDITITRGSCLKHPCAVLNTIYVPTWLVKDYNPHQILAHEVGHIWDDRVGTGVCPATWCGGGIADALVDFIGGKASGLRWLNDTSSIPIEYQWEKSVRGGYGNESTADYLAEAFAWMIYNPSNIPHDNVLWWIESVIWLQTNQEK